MMVAFGNIFVKVHKREDIFPPRLSLIPGQRQGYFILLAEIRRVLYVVDF